jgi:polyphosphate kinase
MDRNLFRRIEVAFPVEAPDLQSRVADDLKLYLTDDTQAWIMNSTGNYTRAEGAADPVCAQTRLLSLYDERVPLIDG